VDIGARQVAIDGVDELRFVKWGVHKPGCRTHPVCQAARVAFRHSPDFAVQHLVCPACDRARVVEDLGDHGAARLGISVQLCLDKDYLAEWCHVQDVGWAWSGV
jgi:hypothetical protein